MYCEDNCLNIKHLTRLVNSFCTWKTCLTSIVTENIRVLRKEQWTIFNEICMQTLQNNKRHDRNGCVRLLSNNKVKYCWWHNNLQSNAWKIKQLMCRSWKQIPRVWQKNAWKHSERSVQRIELFDPNAVSRLEIFKHENTLAIKGDDATLLVIN